MPTFDPAALSQRLHQAGLRSTRAVLGVAELFEQAATHWQPTHADVAARLAQAGEPVNPVTLYRLLDRLDCDPQTAQSLGQGVGGGCRLVSANHGRHSELLGPGRRFELRPGLGRRRRW